MFTSQMGHLMRVTYLFPISNLQFYNLPTYLPSHTPTYIHVLHTYIPIHLPTYILPTFIPYNYVTKCQNKNMKIKKSTKIEHVLMVWSIGLGLGLSLGRSRAQFLTL